jgi:hypothetical protein
VETVVLVQLLEQCSMSFKLRHDSCQHRPALSNSVLHHSHAAATTATMPLPSKVILLCSDSHISQNGSRSTGTNQRCAQPKY